MAARGSKSNAMLYSLITFVGLFLIATVCAVVFYVKSEEYRTQLEAQRSDVERLATQREQGAVARIVGKQLPQKSYLGTMETLVNQLYRTITGKDASEEIPADVKVNDVVMQINAAVEQLGDDANPVVGQDGVGLLNTVLNLKQTLELSRGRMRDLQMQYASLQEELDQTRLALRQQKEEFLGELGTSQALADEFGDRFESLRRQTQQAKESEVGTYRERLEGEQARIRELQHEMEQMRSQMAEQEQQLADALAKLEAIRPRPDVRVAAFEPDARIIRVDLQNDLVTLDIGARDHVYRGLTFAIFQSNAPIPEDGQGKAEIEVFQVGEQVSIARIVRMDRRNPIVADDSVVNLIWDARMSNQFVTIGDFDTNRDGRINPDGVQRVKELIERWGGAVVEDVTIDTDFIVVGIEPTVPLRPTQDELDADPTAFQRYESARRRADEYNSLLVKAGNLNVPTFNYRQFLNLIGYDTLSTQLQMN